MAAAFAVADFAVAALAVGAFSPVALEAAFGVALALGFGAASALLVLPLALISSIRTRIMSCRWPVRRRYLAFCLNLKMMIFGPRSSRSTVPVTEAPLTSGVPTVTSSPSPTSRTRSNVTDAPVSTASFSMTSSLPASTRYCLPPVVTTAYKANSWVHAM